MIDAHLHVWDPAVLDYGWLTPAAGALHARFGVDDARRAAERCAARTGVPVEGAILVQAADTAVETEWLLAQADAAGGWVRGVVGWLPLRSPEAVATALAERDARHVGVRHLLHDDPDPQLLTRLPVRASLALVRDAGLPLDVPDAYPDLLAQAADVVDAVPGLVVVLDHLGKLPLGEDLDRWRRLVRELAARPGTVAKVSGLATSTAPGVPWSAATARPAWDVALDAFGADRLMLGSDYPIAPEAGDYAGSVGPLLELAAELAPGERHALLAGTARRVYGV